MLYYLIKVLISALLIVAITEISKRDSLAAALLASIPFVSVLAMVWLYIDTKDVKQIAELSSGIFWLVLPSLVLFISLPILLKQGVHFYLSLGLASALTVLCYLLMLQALKRFGIEI